MLPWVAPSIGGGPLARGWLLASTTTMPRGSAKACKISAATAMGLGACRPRRRRRRRRWNGRRSSGGAGSRGVREGQKRNRRGSKRAGVDFISHDHSKATFSHSRRNATADRPRRRDTITTLLRPRNGASRPSTPHPTGILGVTQHASARCAVLLNYPPPTHPTPHAPHPSRAARGTA